jgi:hypothetical protein
MSDRVCIRGCTQTGVHYATCAWYGIDETLIPAVAALPNTPPVCKGCAPEPARHMSYLCDRCSRRVHGLVKNAPDLLGRIRSLADPTKARVYELQPARAGRAVTAPAPVAADLLDAADGVVSVLRGWAGFLQFGNWKRSGMRAGVDAAAAFEEAEEWAQVILGQLDRALNTLHIVEPLADDVLTLHPVDPEGERVGWSIADAMARYQVERPDPNAAPWVDEDGMVLVEAVPVPEWSNRLITRAEAAKLVGATEATIRAWVRSGVLEQTAETWAPSRVVWFREQEVRDAAALVAERKGGRPRKDQADADHS